jgi:hypothetical protein
MTSFRKDKKMDDYLLVGAPLMQWFATKGEWKKLGVRCTAIECISILRHAKNRKKLFVVIRGKGGEFSNFAEALGEILFLTDRLGDNDIVSIAFPSEMKPLVVNQAQNMPSNWKKMGAHFRCQFVLFVTDSSTVENISWNDVLKEKA